MNSSEDTFWSRRL